MYIKHDKDLVTEIWGMVMKELPGVWNTKYKILFISIVESMVMPSSPSHLKASEEGTKRTLSEVVT